MADKQSTIAGHRLHESDTGSPEVQIALLTLTAVVSILTVVPGRATRLQGAVHLTLFAAFLFLSVSP